MRFEDEPVPGYPLPILPGHTSPGRFERVLRAGKFAITTELAPPDSADPEDVYKRARVSGCGGESLGSAPGMAPAAPGEEGRGGRAVYSNSILL